MDMDFEDLYRKYSASVFRICRRYTRGDCDAEDLVHEVFIRIHKNLDRFQERSSVFTWIYRIAVNQCLAYLRSRYTHPAHVSADLVDLSSTDHGAGVEARIVLYRMLHRCDSRTRSILFLLYYEGLTQDEVSELLQINRSAVTKRLTQFKQKVSHLLPRDEV